jgi:hypothetical protein
MRVREGAACAFIIFRTNWLFLDEIRFRPLPSKFAQQSSMSDATGHLCRRATRRVGPSPIMLMTFSMPGMSPPGGIMLATVGATICIICPMRFLPILLVIRCIIGANCSIMGANCSIIGAN